MDQVIFLHQIAFLATGGGLLSATADFRPEGNNPVHPVDPV
ncbi:MAG: hypothetical protein ABIJ52_09500 [Pseudomonadota bacterium]